MRCPACNSNRRKNTEIFGVYECRKCDAIYGECYLGDSYSLVLPYWHTGPDGDIRYYDLTCLGSEGVTRRHGWFNTKTRRIVQTG